MNLFVWSALLTVTLCSLAAGYYVGGALADRGTRPQLLGWILLAAAGLLAATFQIRLGVLKLGMALGPKAGPLLAAAILFGPSLTALGMLCPAAIRLTTNTVATTGHRVGAVYGISTVGSVVGTLITGFALLPALDTGWIVFGTVALLTLVGVVLLGTLRKGSIAALLIPLLGWPGGPKALPPSFALLYRAQSLYGLIEVLDDNHRGIRFLRADHSIIGAHRLADRSAPFAFVNVIAMARFLRPDPKRALQMGLGIGSVPTAFASNGITSDVVEIDEKVVRVARDFFGFVPNGSVFVDDARAVVRRLPRSHYDLVVHDTFTGGTAPEHLLTVEFLKEAKTTLSQNAVLVVNVPGYHQGKRADASRAVLATLRSVFANVRAFRDMSPSEEPDSAANIVFFASDGPLEFSFPAPGGFATEAEERTARSMSSWEVLEEPSEGRIITDENNPLSRMQLASAFEHFRAMNELLPEEVWLR